MKTIIAALLILFSLTVAAEETYLCKSSNGEITVIEMGEDAVIVDFSSHRMIHEPHSYIIFSDLVKSSEVNYMDFVLSISQELFSKKSGSKFENTSSRLLLKTRVSKTSQTCRIEFVMSKTIGVASLEYVCSTFLKTNSKLEDDLICE